MLSLLFIENVAMNDYDFGKYYRNKNRKPPVGNVSGLNLQKVYRKISIAVAAGLVLFFAGLMTGIKFEENRIVQKLDLTNPETHNTDVVESADLAPKNSAHSQNSKISDDSNAPADEKMEAPSQENLREALMDPENEYIILARRYSEESKDRALYYAGVLSKISKENNYKVIPSIRGKNIKIYVGPMKGKRNAEKMLARVKSIPEFTNSAILYKK